MAYTGFTSLLDILRNYFQCLLHYIKVEWYAVAWYMYLHTFFRKGAFFKTLLRFMAVRYNTISFNRVIHFLLLLINSL